MTNTPKGIEIALNGAGLAPVDPNSVVATTHGVDYGLCERDGRSFLCTRVREDWKSLLPEPDGWKILMPASEGMLGHFRRFQDRPDVLADLLTTMVLSEIREKGLAQ